MDNKKSGKIRGKASVFFERLVFMAILHGESDRRNLPVCHACARFGHPLMAS